MSNFLIGMPGCGKSTVIEQYEIMYGEQVYDTDCIIEHRHGSISQIFENFGEQYFRDLETDVIRELCGLGDNALIATGGGAVLREENVKLFKTCGKVIYLRAKLETLLKGLKVTRPDLF